MTPSRTGRLAASIVAALLVFAPPPAAADDGSDDGPVDTVPPPGAIALTFDDGPFEDLTPIILDVLDRYGIKATFFISAYRFRYNTNLIDEIVSAGHSVQSHGFDHVSLVGLPEQEVLEQLRDSIDLIVGAGAPRPRCLRPPYGAVDDVVRRVAKKLDLEIVMWTQNSFDYAFQDVDRVVDATLAGLAPGDVVLMHDQWAVIDAEALPIIIESALGEGMRFAPICAAGFVESKVAKKLRRIGLS